MSGRTRTVAAIGAAASVLLAGCMPQELVLRRSSVDWDGLGIHTVAVQPISPKAAAGPAPATASGSATGSVLATSSLVASGSVVATAAELEAATRDAAELLAFALTQSAVRVSDDGSATEPRLEVTVKDVTVLTEEYDLTDAGADAPRKPRTLMSIHADPGYPRTPDRVIKATVLVRLLHPGQARPIWFKEAIGMVDLGLARNTSPSSVDPFPPPARAERDTDAEALDYFREIAVRRALKQIADDLLPHYEYVELK